MSTAPVEALEASPALFSPPELRLTDPVHVPVTNPSAFTRFCLSLINDERDLPFIWTGLEMTLVVLPAAVLMCTVLPWYVAPLYWALVFAGYLDRYILMLHNTCHRPLFKKRYAFFNRYIPWVLGSFFGETPESYGAHHLGMHHPENNLPADLSSTMGYHRDRLSHFLHYYGRFIAIGLAELVMYLRSKGRSRLATRLLTGEFSFWIAVAVLAYFNWKAAIIVFVVPVLFVRFMMMAGNWAQHSFIDPKQPGNAYVNSITCINCRYNQRAFNDGYHIGHHVQASRHWTDMPGDFQANIPRYAAEGAVVFDGLDHFMVWLYLMLGRFDWLARHYVNLDGKPRSEAEVIALLRERVLPIQTPA